MKSRTFAVYSDPGHAWVKVHIPFLARLLGADWRSKFTPFSYERGDYAYLEEDLDAATLQEQCRLLGIQPVFRHVSYAERNYSRIRNYQPIR
jgi:hypothetical protein